MMTSDTVITLMSMEGMGIGLLDYYEQLTFPLIMIIIFTGTLYALWRVN